MKSAPGARRRHETRRLAELEAFIAEHGRHPKTTASSTAERRLAEWAARVRSGKIRVDARNKARVRAFYAGTPGQRRMHNNLLALANFVAVHGHPPRTSVPREHRLASWAWKVRTSRVKVPDHIKARVTELSPGFQQISEAQRLAELEAFVEQHARRPNAGTGIEAVERHLGYWAWRVRSGRGNVTPATRARVRKIYATLPDNRRGWQRKPTDHRLAELQAFVDRTGHRPSATADDPAERSTWRWAWTVRVGDATVAAETVARVKEIWAQTPKRSLVGQTDHRLAELEEFVARTSRFPRTDGIVARANGGAERALAIWAANVRTGKSKVSPEVAAAVAEIRDWFPPPTRGAPKRTS